MKKIYNYFTNLVYEDIGLSVSGQKCEAAKKEDAIDGAAAIERRLTVGFKVFLGFLLLVIILVVILVPVCIDGLPTKPNEAENWFPSPTSNSKLGIYSTAAVSTDAAPCGPIGRDILARNGSAVDAAIAVIVCMGVVNPQSSGLGGGFHMIVYKKESREAYFIDAREKAPSRAYENMYNGNSTLAKTGPLAIAVPGELAGYEEVYRRFGSLPWKDLFQPTIELCKNGIEVSKHLAKTLKNLANVIKKKDRWNFFVNNETGEVHKEGDKFRRLDLVPTLEAIAEHGRDALYGQTDLAAKFMQDLKNMGSIITQEDMMNYSVKIDTPINLQLRDNLTLYSSPPPGSGALLGMMLNVLEGYNVTKRLTRSKAESALAFHRIIETFKFTYARRMELEDNSATMPDFAKLLMSNDYAAQIRSQIDDSKTYHDPEHYGLKNSTFEADNGTASMTVVAPNGDAVAVTTTVNLYFGSQEMSTSTGIILNDEMDDFSLPNMESYFNVPPSIYNRILPGKRPASSMCPAIIVDHCGNVRLAISGNGGTKITTNVLQVILQNLWLGEDIKSSIDGYRIHHQLLPDYVQYEEGFPEELIEELRKKGHEFESLSQMTGIVVAVSKENDGKLNANYDFRKGGDVTGF